MLKRPYRKPWWRGGRPDTRDRAILTNFGEREPWTDRMSDGCTLVSDPPETGDGVPVHVVHTFDRANGAVFNESRDHLKLLFAGENVHRSLPVVVQGSDRLAGISQLEMLYYWCRLTSRGLAPGC
jgi:hypothetical protein